MQFGPIIKIFMILQNSAPRSTFRPKASLKLQKNGFCHICCCSLPFDHHSKLTWVGEIMLTYGNRLRSTHCREFPYLKLCRPADFVRTTQLSYFYNAIRLNFDLSFSIIPLLFRAQCVLTHYCSVSHGAGTKIE